MDERSRNDAADQADGQRVAALVDEISAEPASQAADHIESLPDVVGFGAFLGLAALALSWGAP